MRAKRRSLFAQVRCLAGAFLAVGGAVSPAANAAGAAKPTPRYRWEQIEQQSVTLVGPCGIVWQFNFGAGLTKPYFHPLQTVDGQCLTQISPRDHRWHYGLWHSWKTIDGINYWEEDQPGGRPAGVTRIAECRLNRLDETGAQIQLRLAYHPAGKPDAVVLREVVELTVGMPREDGSYVIQWNHTSRAERSLNLDRTPPPGFPEGKDFGGYAGLSFRGDRFLKQVSLRTSEGQDAAAAQRRPARWASFSGTVDNRPVALTLFDHPSNPRHPTPWYHVMRPDRGGAPNSPFWYLNAAFLNDAAFTLEPGRPLSRRYLIRIDRQRPAPAELETEFARFAATKPNPA